MKKTRKQQLSRELSILLIGVLLGVFGGATANTMHALVYDNSFVMAFKPWAKVTYGIVTCGGFIGLILYCNSIIKRLS